LTVKIDQKIRIEKLEETIQGMAIGHLLGRNRYNNHMEMMTCMEKIG